MNSGGKPQMSPLEIDNTNNKVCIYVKSDNSEKYTSLVSTERKTWEEVEVEASIDLEEGAMLRADENVMRYASGDQNQVISHDSERYKLYRR